MSGDPRLEGDSSPKTAQLLEKAFLDALRGDREALDVLVTLLRTRYSKVIQGRLRVHRGLSSTATVEDVFQDSLVWLVEQMKAGPDGDIPEQARQNVLQYFQSLCDRRIENLRKPRLDPVLERHKSALPFDLIEDKRRGKTPREVGNEDEHELALSRHRALIQAEMDRLGPLHRQVLELHLAGAPYTEMSKESGLSISALESLLVRIKQRLAERIFYQSQTAQIHRRNEATRKAPSPARETRPPSAGEIRAALNNLPVDIKRAIEFVHLQGGSVEDLAASLGADGLEKANARLERGYESLWLELDVLFPESFSLLRP